MIKQGPVRPRGVVLLCDFADARLEALSQALSGRGLLLVRAQAPSSATVLLQHVRVNALIVGAQSAERTAYLRLAAKEKLLLLDDPGLDPDATAEHFLAALT